MHSYCLCSFLQTCMVGTERLLTLIPKELCILSARTSLLTSCNMYSSLLAKNLWRILTIWCLVSFSVSLTLCSYSRPDRIVPIAERFGMDPGAVLDNVSMDFYCIINRFMEEDLLGHPFSLWMWKIIYARAYTYEHQYNLLLGLAAKMSEEPFRLLASLSPYSFKIDLPVMLALLGLVWWSLCACLWNQIVDSVIALFRVDFTGRGELAERQVNSKVSLEFL